MNDSELPGPIPGIADAGFWSACARQELTFRHCKTCGAWHHPPLPLCPACQSLELEWSGATGRALLFSWTRVHLAMHPSVVQAVPYYIGLVEFPECGGVRLLARLECAGAASPTIGSECELYWVIAAGGQSIPAFLASPGAS